jgi:hypothetical protein
VPTWRQSACVRGEEIAGCGQTQGELNYRRIAKSKNNLPLGSLMLIKWIPLLERGF